MSTTEHTPTPWHINGRYIQRGNRITAELWATKNPKQAEANGVFIVRACNSHEQLLEALKALYAQSWMIGMRITLAGTLPAQIEMIRKQAEAAIAAAESG